MTRKIALARLAILVVLLSGCGQSPRQETPDLLLVGGKLFTSDAAQPWAEAVAVSGERILAVGSTEEIERLGDEATRRIYLDGRVVIPGMNDAHRHFRTVDPGVHQLALTPLEPSWLETREAITRAVEQVPDGTPIFGVVGVAVVTNPEIDRAALDELAPDNPVILAAFYGHGLILNSTALAAMGIDDEEPDPAGGFFGREPGSARVNGRVFEYAQWKPMRALAAEIADEHIVAQLREQASEMLRLGMTSFLDMPLIPLAQYVRLLGASDLPLRVRVTRFPMTDVGGRNVEEDRDVTVPAAVRDRVVISGIKWILEGTPLERGVLLREPYSDRPDWSGRLNFPPEEIAAILAESLETEEQLLLHVAGDRTIELIFDAMDAIGGVDWPSKRVRLEHGDGLTGDLVERAARLGVVVVQNPTHFGLGEIMHSRLGPERGFFRMRSLIEAGIPVALGSDGPPNPWLDVMLAVIHPTDPTEALSVEQAIEAYTRVAAYAEFQEHEKGTLAPGMLADLAVLSQDVFLVPPDAIPATESVLTLIDGRIVYDAGVL